MLLRKSKKSEKTPSIYAADGNSNELEKLRLELIEAKYALDAAYSILQNVTEPDLIDSAIYELKSVQMRYTFLHKKFVELSA